MQSLLEHDAEQLRASLKGLCAELTGVPADQVLHANGSKTMGGLTQATTDFENLTDTAFAPPPEAARDVAATAVSLARRIVTGHHFHNGNGRTCMWALYLWMGNFGFKFAIKPRYLHGYMFSETEIDTLPDGLVDVVLAFSVPATVQQIKSHLKHMRAQLVTLEDDRHAVKEAAKRFGRLATECKPLNPSGLAGLVATRDLWTNYRPAMLAIARHVQQHNSPVTAFLAATWLSKMIQAYGDDDRKITLANVELWLSENVKPAVQ